MKTRHTAFPLAIIRAIRAIRGKNLGETERLWGIAVHAFSQTSLGKRGFATCWRQTAYIRFDQHVGLSLWIAMQSGLTIQS
jgi:hypothetical protein